MAIKLYEEPKKTELNEKEVLANLTITKTKICYTVKYHNHTILKLEEEATKDEVKDYLSKNKDVLNKFIEKVKTSNSKRIKTIKDRNDELKEIRKEEKLNKYREDYRKKI